VEGKNSSMLINGGISYIVPELLRQLEEFQIDEKKINKFLILHSHFDHVGIVPYFKKRYPELTVYASLRAQQILHNPKAINSINRSSRYAAKKAGRSEAYSDCHLDWPSDLPIEALSEGDVIDLGDLEIDIFDTPGHSSCCVSAYAPQLKALFPSDAGGVPCKQRINVYGTYNYTQFQQSLEKLKDLDVEYLCADHYGYVSGLEAKGFIRQAITLARERRTLMLDIYQKTGDINASAKELAEIFKDDNADDFISPQVFEEAYRFMLKHIIASC
jgi:glyoxylase-like metal-dependent hydrolase (beta-lactamase superfamily II)